MNETFSLQQNLKLMREIIVSNKKKMCPKYEFFLSGKMLDFIFQVKQISTATFFIYISN